MAKHSVSIVRPMEITPYLTQAHTHAHHTHRDRDRQTHRQTDTHTHTHTERERERERDTGWWRCVATDSSLVVYPIPKTQPRLGLLGLFESPQI